MLPTSQAIMEVSKYKAQLTVKGGSSTSLIFRMPLHASLSDESHTNDIPEF